MVYPLFPVSPLPGSLNREPRWNEYVARYDSGHRDGGSAWGQPMYAYAFSLKNKEHTAVGSLEAFYNGRKGTSLPFLMADPIQNRIESAAMSFVQSNMRRAFTVDSHQTIPASGQFVLVSVASGVINPTSGWYTYSQDNGVFTFTVPTTNDTLRIGSCHYFKKCNFASTMRFSYPIWGIGNVAIQIEEMIPEEN